MNKDEIKKALGYCSNTQCPRSEKCPYNAEFDCADILCKDALNLITEQEKEIEQLKAECEYRKKQYDNQVAENTRLHIEYDKAFERLKAQQREIERLKTTLGQCNTELNSALESLKSQCREIGELKAENERVLGKLADVLMCIESTTEIDISKLVKQAKIDVLNELKNRLVVYYPSVLSVIDELIKEIKK